jgi:uncharacterized phage protein (TIGR01671 family)
MPLYSVDGEEKPHYVYDVEQIYDGYTDRGCCEIGWVSSFGALIANPEEYTVEQCTGLKDKNGKLIYEGDIVKGSMGVGVVKYGEFNCSCCDGVYGFTFGYDADIRVHEEHEVIGNIHENAELLDEND